MKKFIYFTFVILTFFVLNSCRKTIINDPDDTLFILNVYTNLRPEAKYYIVFENSESEAQSYLLANFYIMQKTRGLNFFGNTINIHFVLIDEVEDNTVSITSYYDVPIGKNITITNNDLKHTEAPSSEVVLNFLNIPAFDIVSRTAKNSEQAFTLNTIETPATTPALGGETYNGAELFYACFQTATSASYKLERIPETTNYNINFSTLSSSMTKYTYPKSINGIALHHADVQAFDNPSLFGKYVELFNVDDFSIFPNTTFDVYIPAGERQLGYFVHNFRFEQGAQQFNNWYYSTVLYNDISPLNGGLSITELATTGLPLIASTPENYDVAEFNFATDGFDWKIYAPNTEGFYFPSIPAEVVSEFSSESSFVQVLSTLDGGTVKLTDYSHIENYESILDIYFNIDNTPFKILNSSIKSQEQPFSF